MHISTCFFRQLSAISKMVLLVMSTIILTMNLLMLTRLQSSGTDQNYICMGQPATQFSGGEAQRVKLAMELAKRATGKTLYALNKPTTGLHFADIHNLLHVLRRLLRAAAAEGVATLNPELDSPSDVPALLAAL